MNAHVRRHIAVYRTTGHIWLGRFKAFAIQEDDHLRVILRYVERNPLRANLVERAEHWPLSSLARPTSAPTLDSGPAPRNAGWIEAVNAPMTEAECRAIRHATHRQSPLGDAPWVETTAARLGIKLDKSASSQSDLNPVCDGIAGLFATRIRTGELARP